MEVAAHLGGIPRQSFAMSFGIGIARLHAQTERADNRFCRLQFVGKFLQLRSELTRAKDSSG
jgi:hypothetical protein